MAYTPDNDIWEIYRGGNEWQAAKDKKQKDEIQKKVKRYYDSLAGNGYSKLADTLSKSDSNARKNIYNKYAQAGKSSTRDYLNSLGIKYGLSKDDMNNLIGWNNATGEVSFGGKNIGKPDAVVDGVSYFKDTSKLDNAVSDYVKRSGTTVPNGVDNPAFNQSMQDARTKNSDYFSMMKNDHDKYDNASYSLFDTANSDIINSKEYKSAFNNIMPSYTLKAAQGYDNEIADGAASNSGNIDSFAEANARRQQAALTAKGQALAHQMGLEAYNSRIQNAQNVLNNLGINNDRIYSHMENAINADMQMGQHYFNNSQTEKMNNDTLKTNDVARKSQVASVAGYVPDEWVASNNPYMNDDGTIKNEFKNVDFKAVLDKARANGDTETAKNAAMARFYKIMGNYGMYGKYDDGDYAVSGKQKTEDARQFDEQIAAADRALNAEKENEAAKLKNNLDQINAETQGKKEIIQEEAKYKNSNSNGNSVTDDGVYSQSGVKLSDKNGKPILSLNDTKTMIEEGNTSEQVQYAKQYYGLDDSIGAGADNTMPDVDDAEWSEFYNTFGDKEKIQKFLTDVIKPIYNAAGTGNYTRDELESKLKNAIINNTKDYDVDKEDAVRILNRFGANTSWLDDYRNRWGFNSRKGMIKK